jgi:hypothetical protein
VLHTNVCSGRVIDNIGLHIAICNANVALQIAIVIAIIAVLGYRIPPNGGIGSPGRRLESQIVRKKWKKNVNTNGYFSEQK